MKAQSPLNVVMEYRKLNSGVGCIKGQIGQRLEAATVMLMKICLLGQDALLTEK
jgi:hypothetical protein